MELKVFEAFAGIGSQRRALDNIKANYKIVGLAEWFIPAIIGYHAIHDNLKLTKSDKTNAKTSITKMICYLKTKPLSMDSKTLVNTNYWNNKSHEIIKLVYKAVVLSEKRGNIFNVQDLYKRGLKDIDLLTYSFPCQDLSQQGKQKGMSKDSVSRSGLLWEIEKSLDYSSKNEIPQYLLMENVSALLHQKNQNDLNAWISKLENLGYKNTICSLNSALFGSPQARNRVFMISSLNRSVKLPIGNFNPRNKSINAILNKSYADSDILLNLQKYNRSDFKLTNSNIRKSSLIGYTNFNSEAYVYDPYYTGPTLTASGANSRIKILQTDIIRKLNAEECFKYMGFKSSDFKKINKLSYLNTSQLIYLCGNSISIEVLSEIIKEIYNDFIII